MNWNDFVLLGLGLGLGFGACRLLQQSATNSLPSDQHIANNPTNNAIDASTDTPEAILLSRVQQLEIAYQMASEMSQFKGGFMARISHELRSPLNGLIGMHQLILSDLCDDPAEEREFIAQANESALKMVKILDDLLAVAKTQHGTSNLEIQPLELVQVLQEVGDMTYLLARDRNLQLKINLPEADIYILVDPRRFKQVLVNLIDSSIAQMSEGLITVSVHPSADPEYIHIWVDDQRPIADYSEPIDLLQTDPTTASLPSPGLNILASLILLQAMQGHLEIVPATSGAVDPINELPLTRIQCSVPLVLPDEVNYEGKMAD